ncbi:MAG: glycosyltransferase [Bacteroidetes bacterium]|nr:MAG: glycosyltransferase [Bacteroidota bacterium]TAE68696.1 MAG: glycosyltransferase [Bacteroidota bacterium]TAF94851.1 MAG: glycosyltransferase [Bacteroidota bacterium]
MRKTVSIIVPVYNEQENIHILLQEIHSYMKPLPYQYQIVLVDDGSTDGTLAQIQLLTQGDTTLRYLSFSKNFGHQAALKAGLDVCQTDCCISMDGDMQHPPELLPVLLQHWEQGNDVVYTIREESTNLPYVKRVTSNLFYDLLNGLSSIELDRGSADFRLLDKKVVQQLKQLQEYDIFFRGLVKWVGFRQIGITYQSRERTRGTSKYTLKKMIRLALQGITSFSIKPLYIATYLGFVFSLLALAFVPYVLYSYYFGKAVSGWTSTIITIAFFGGLQLMILGIIGIYLGKLFMQSKGRPLYIVQQAYLPNEA